LVRNGIELRDDLPLDDLVVLIDDVPEKSAGDDLRGDIDDVSFDKYVVRDRVITSVFDPIHHGNERDGNEPGDHGQCEDTARTE
jgi:hypothetical protein